MRRPYSSASSMLPPADRIASLGGLTAVLVGLALCAIVGQAVAGRSAGPRPVAGVSPGTAKGRSVTHRADRGSHRSAVAPLERQVREVVAAERTPVARRTLGVRSLPPADVSPVRVDHARGWAFGTSAIAPPAGTAALPDASLFIARRTARGWSVALTGTPEFISLLRRAPVTVVTKGERPFLERFSRTAAPGGGAVTGLALPWDKGQSRTLETTGGGLRFGGGDGRVLAPGPGRLYRLCAKGPSRGMLLLIHSSGLASEFYGMTQVTGVKEGAVVREGSYLGRTGTDRPCGGSPATGPAAVSFALAGARRPVPLDGACIGGWTLHVAEGAVSADRPGVHVDAGNPLLNFGAEPPASPPPGSPSPTPAPPGRGHKGVPVGVL
jgi:hypothetical protein